MDERNAGLNESLWFLQDSSYPQEPAAKLLVEYLRGEIVVCKKFSRTQLFHFTMEGTSRDQSADREKYPVRERTVTPACFGRIVIFRNVSSRIGFEG